MQWLRLAENHGDSKTYLPLYENRPLGLFFIFYSYFAALITDSPERQDPAIKPSHLAFAALLRA
jgi:hypothetical protein